MSPSLYALAGIGLLLGLRHAFEPDHLAAVSTLATRQGRLLDAGRNVAIDATNLTREKRAEWLDHKGRPFRDL